MVNQLAYYLDEWSLTDPEPLAQTRTSDVYLVTLRGERVVLKLLTERGIDERNGAVTLRYWGGRGAVRLLNADQDAHLLEYADGDDLVALVMRGGDQQATAIIADVLNRLHGEPRDTLPFGLPSLDRWFRSLYQKAKADQARGENSIYSRAAALVRKLLAEKRDVRVLHGDIHHMNIRYKDGRGWLAFDPQGIIGERTFDAANTLCNPIHMSELVHNEDRLFTNATILADGINVERSRLLYFTYCYACLSASWTLADGDDPSHALTVAQIIEPHIHAEIP